MTEIKEVRQQATRKRSQATQQGRPRHQSVAIVCGMIGGQRDDWPQVSIQGVIERSTVKLCNPTNMHYFSYNHWLQPGYNELVTTSFHQVGLTKWFLNPFCLLLYVFFFRMMREGYMDRWIMDPLLSLVSSFFQPSTSKGS